MGGLDPYTLETDGISGIEHAHRTAQYKFYWKPLAKMWGFVAKQNVIWGYDRKYGANLPVTVDTTTDEDRKELEEYL